MWLECEWRHARKQWAENLGILKNTSVESRLWASRVGSLLRTSPVGCRMGTGRVGSRFGPCREFKLRLWCWEVGVSTVEACGYVFRVPTKGVRKSIHQSWLAKGLELELLCWGSGRDSVGRASTLKVGSVAFPPGQCTSPQRHPCHRLFDQDGHQVSSSPSL